MQTLKTAPEFIATTPEQVIKLSVICEKMQKAGICSCFIDEAYEAACFCQGTFDLMDMWYDEVDEQEKHDILNDIEESLDDIRAGANVWVMDGSGEDFETAVKIVKERTARISQKQERHSK